jgi:hypothetical protein
MALGRDEATRILRFCLAGDGWGTATYEGDAHVLKLVLTGAERAEARRFEGPSFEEVLADAVSAGVLKGSCVAKQIAFLGGTSARTPAPRNDPPAEAGPALFLEITAAISALLHETQRERGISSLYTTSAGRLFSDQLTAQWRATDRRHQELIAFRKQHAGPLPSTLADKLAHAEELLADLTAARHRVEELETKAAMVIESYSHANGELLQVIDAMLSRLVDPPRRSSALAWMALLHAKEKTGIERAQLASAFERDRYAAGQYQAVLSVIAARQSYLHLFQAAAPAPVEELLRAKLDAKLVGAVEEMERIALSHRNGKFGVDAGVWFATISKQIDLFADVESAVLGNLIRAPL